MRQKYKAQEDYTAPLNIQPSPTELSPYSRPVKSPSPDKKPANIIVSTKSPELQPLKHPLYPVDKDLAISSWHSHKEHLKEKPFSVSTPSKYEREHQYIQDTRHTGKGDLRTAENESKNYNLVSNSRVRNTRIEIVAQNTPEDFDEKASSRVREINRSDSMELDYLRLLKSKQETIKQLKEIIEMIKRNNTSMEELDDDGRYRQLQERIAELTSEVKELKIENQHMLNVIQKQKKKKPTTPLRDEILQREIRELKASLREKELQMEENNSTLKPQINAQKQKIDSLENENQSLVRLLKEKQESLGNSALSVHSKASDKEKLSLMKIKEQHQENLKLMKENIRQEFYSQFQQLQKTYQYQLDELTKKLHSYGLRIAQVEMSRNQIKQRLPHEAEKSKVRQEYHKQKERHQEIESLMLQKYSKYQTEISQVKNTNNRLIQELTKANKQIDDLNQRSLSYSQELSRLKEKQADDELITVIEERNNLLKKIEILNAQRQNLKQQFEEFSTQKQVEINQLEKKIELILIEYENHNKEARSRSDSKISDLQEQLKTSNKKEVELIDYYQKDKIDTEDKVKLAIDLYNKQNQTLKATLTQKTKELVRVTQQLEALRLEHTMCSQLVSEEELKKIEEECNGLRRRCLNFEKEVATLTEELMQMDATLKERDQLVLKLQKTNLLLQEERDILGKKVAQADIKNNDLTIRSSRRELDLIDHQTQISHLQKQIMQNQQHYHIQLTELKKQILLQEKKNSHLNERIQGKESEIQDKNAVIAQLQNKIQQQQLQYIKWDQGQLLEEDLKELRRLVFEYYLKTSSNAQKENVQEYYKLTYNYQIKLEENIKLTKSLQQLKSQLSAQERQHQLLIQKISLLQNNNAIYERQLKQRRLLHDQLLQDKIRIQKQILLSKKIKVQQNHIESTYKGNLNDITSKIDRLLDLEQQRNQRMKGLLLIRQGSPERK